MKKVIVLKTGDTLPAIAGALGDFEDWIIMGLGIHAAHVRVVDVPATGDLPPVDMCKGIVIAGSHAMVTQDLDWSVAIEQWVPSVVKAGTPLLGICYGHQLLARAMGGVVDYHARGLEIGTVGINTVYDNRSDPLFNGLPKKFKAHVCHSQTVIKLPENAVRMAGNDFEPNHAFRIGSSAWGVQFHPEYDEEIMTAYAENMTSAISESGLSLSHILENIAPTPEPHILLKRFGNLVK